MKERYNTLNNFYQQKFNSKIAKIPLDGNFTCPNIDGTKAFKGCIFCSAGSSSFKEYKPSLEEQFDLGVKIARKKWKDPNIQFIAYFQANTNTYDNVENLKRRFEPFINRKDILGIDISTRADCIDNDVLNYLIDINKRTFLTIELGLQTIHEKTRKTLNRHESLEDFEEKVKLLVANKINVVVHIMNGFPNETKEDMLNTVRYLNKLHINGIKIHMLFIEKDTILAEIYNKKPFKILSKDEYVDIVVSQLEILNKDIIVYRLTGDPDKETCIEPKWAFKKFIVLNDIVKSLVSKNTYQGFKQSILNYVHREYDKLKPNDIVIDATMGNGNDSIYLSKKCKLVLAFEIQKIAINNSKKLFINNNIKNIKIFPLSHDKFLNSLQDYIGKISLITYNLGYLPKGNKKITTLAETTLNSIKQAMVLLHRKGIILITIYLHQEGKKEEKMILEYLGLNNIKYEVFRNTNNSNAPYLLKIYKSK